MLQNDRGAVNVPRPIIIFIIIRNILTMIFVIIIIIIIINTLILQRVDIIPKP